MCLFFSFLAPLRWLRFLAPCEVRVVTEGTLASMLISEEASGLHEKCDVSRGAFIGALCQVKEVRWIQKSEQ